MEYAAILEKRSRSSNEATATTTASTRKRAGFTIARGTIADALKKMNKHDLGAKKPLLKVLNYFFLVLVTLSPGLLLPVGLFSGAGFGTLLRL
jgi:hypothetical protein